MATRTTTIRRITTTSVVSGDGIPQWLDIDNSFLTFEELVRAYFDCRLTKRNSFNARAFEFSLEKNLFGLYQDLLQGNYRVGRSIAFVVEHPKVREIWAATFRDRIVHHVIYNRLSPRFYPLFIRNSFACIPGRGTLDGSSRLWAGIRSVTRNGKEPAYFLQGDIRNFFVSIDKNILFAALKPRLSEPWLDALTRQVLFHDPRSNCWRKSSPAAFERVPRHKSLWYAPVSRGLPIGNLTSQFFANVYLDALDQFVKHTLRVKHYYRYVDDFVVLHPCPQRLNRYFVEIGAFCRDQLALELHPFKKRLAPIGQGIDFIGFVHKPFYRRLRLRTASRMAEVVRQWEDGSSCYDAPALERLRASLNSYLGIAKWASTYGLRQGLGERVRSLFVYPSEDYGKVCLAGR